jgi:hypothetical protein
LLVAIARSPSLACVGPECLQIWSTADGGGALTVTSNFLTKKVQTFESFCVADRSQCLYSTIDPGFMAPTDDAPPSGNYRIVDGTRVRVVLVSTQASLSLNVNGQKLSQPNESALLGTMPTIHNHPSWQLVVPGDEVGDYPISFKLTSDSPFYAESAPITLIVTNAPLPEGTPTATPTEAPTTAPTPCPGDCSADVEVTVDELITCVNLALGTADVEACPPCDVDGDGSVTIDEIIAAVNAALVGCPMPPAVTLAEIQSTIFTPRCAIPSCHNTQSASGAGNLDLSSGQAYAQLVGVAPDVASARNAGVLRVDPGHPENSFLLSKIIGPPLGQGSKMPLTGAPLTADETQLIRDWILQGASP